VRGEKSSPSNLARLRADQQRARRRALEGAEQAGKLEIAALALIGLARELDAELAEWHADVEDARRLIARER
jgi:hypothetical protein